MDNTKLILAMLQKMDRSIEKLTAEFHNHVEDESLRMVELTLDLKQRRASKKWRNGILASALLAAGGYILPAAYAKISSDFLKPKSITQQVEVQNEKQ